MENKEKEIEIDKKINREIDKELHFKIKDIKKHLINHKNFKNNQKTFFIFMIFIKHREKKELIILELEKLKTKGYLKGDMNDLYKKFKALVIPLIKIYFLINQQLLLTSSKTKKNIIKTKTNKTNKKTKKSKTTKTIKNGGFLFMLEDKGDQPITGKDFTKMLDKYGESLELLFFTKYGQDPTVTTEAGEELTTDIANPMTGFKTILDLSRKKIYDGLFDQSGVLFKNAKNIGINDLFDVYQYYSLYKLYNKEYKRSESIKIKKIPKPPAEPTLGEPTFGDIQLKPKPKRRKPRT
jgi:hypothetical protein